MAGKLIGIQIGNSEISMAQLAGASTKVVVRRMPENLIKDGQIISAELLARFLKEMKKEGHFSGNASALVLPEMSTYFRTIEMPPMSEAQLKLNLPYEFRDYVGSESVNYFYDYAVDEIEVDEQGQPVSLRLFAAAAFKTVVAEYSDLFRRAGLKLKIAVPREMALITLLRYLEEQNGDKYAKEAAINEKEAAKAAKLAEKEAKKAAKLAEKERKKKLKEQKNFPYDVVLPEDAETEKSEEAEGAEETGAEAAAANDTVSETENRGKFRCIVDIGYEHTNVDIACDGRLTASKVIDVGCQQIDEAIAELYSSDVYLAASRREANYENVLSEDVCKAVYERIALEIMKAINFYRYENPSDDVDNVVFVGSGAAIDELTQEITEYVQFERGSIDEVLPAGCAELTDAYRAFIAFGLSLS